MEVLEAIRTRRGILKYKTTPVDDKTIEVVLGAARWAPSWANTQCWRFVVVRDKKIKSWLADTLVGDLIRDIPNPAIEAIKTVPVVIVACAEVGQSGRSRGAPEPDTDKGDYWYMFDVALAMQNLVLAACSLGLGTRYVGGIDAKKVAEILEVPAGFSVVAMTPLGYPVEDPEVRPRKELSEIVFNDIYGSG
ncbi:MAG: nitroreductase [Dehalococcoidales bacterium]|jgi:nitroreductase|nr:nitroreductase [Dehalococcoidales bacterium]|tara:strand:- start:745 stop:1320 length:576 start_codon:yes stop_codon:yes gene_type:complete